MTLTKVGIWLPAATMGYDFGPSRTSKAHLYPGPPYDLAPGATVIFPINLGDMSVKLVGKQTEVGEITYFASNDRTEDVYSSPVAAQTFLRAIEDTPAGMIHPPGDESIAQA